MEDLTFTDLNEPSFVFAPEEAPLTVRMTNVPVSFRKDAISDTGIFYDHEKNLSEFEVISHTLFTDKP